MACRPAVKKQPLSEPSTTVALAGTGAGTTSMATGYELQAGESTIQWKAGYVVGGGHEGTLRLVSGNLAADAAGKWVGGYFVIDMNTITITDLKEQEERNSLENHLKNDDFFAVPKHPRAYFTLTQAVAGTGPHAFTISGKLSIKGIIRDISFPATLETTGNQVKARATLTIDRTKWGINYQSGSIFSNLKDGIISDNIPVTLELVFKKMQQQARC